MRAKVTGAPLEDAKRLTQCYDSMEQEAIDVSRRQAKAREGTGTPDIALKLEASEAKLQDLKSNVAILGKEAAAVYAQEQTLTLQRLVALMILECQSIEAASSPITDSMPQPPSYEELRCAFTYPTYNGSADRRTYFLGKVVYSYEADTELQLNLSFFFLVAKNGWAEGECIGKAGWFPLRFIERQE